MSDDDRGEENLWKGEEGESDDILGIYEAEAK